MQPEGRLIETIELENGIAVYFYDQSRGVLGDRWQVKLLAMIPMEVKPDYFDEFDNPEEICKEFVSLVGKTISFQIERLRNFIDRSDVSQTLAELKDEFLRSNLDYISRPHFARRFILRNITNRWKMSVWDTCIASTCNNQTEAVGGNFTGWLARHASPISFRKKI